MNYTQFHGNTFLFVDTNEVEINHETNLPRLPYFQELQKSLIKKCEVDLTMRYTHIETIGGTKEAGGTAHYECSFFNKDGSEAELCGNALFALMKQEWKHDFYHFHTKAGVIEGVNSQLKMVLKMPKAEIFDSNAHRQNILAYWFRINIGNKHHIVLHHKNDWQKVCDGMNKYEKSPEMNTHIAQKLNNTTFQVRCFERGVGETNACGSGAYAVGIAMMKHFNLDKVKIVMKGGEYTVQDGLLIVEK